jgi:hypothetical protein
MTGMWFASAVRCELPELKPQCTVAARSTSKASTPSVTRDYVSQLAGYVLRDIPRCSPVLPSKQHDHQHKRDQGQDQGHHRQRLSTTSVSLPRPSTQPGLLGQASARAANRVVAKNSCLTPWTASARRTSASASPRRTGAYGSGIGLLSLP